jgi:hypothetical protein
MACACYQDLLVESQLGACLIDPITYEVLEDPVVAADGQTYSRSSITDWFQTCKAPPRSPLTNNELPHTQLMSNQIVKSVLDILKQNWKKKD